MKEHKGLCLKRKTTMAKSTDRYANVLTCQPITNRICPCGTAEALEAKLREARGLVEKWRGEVIPVPDPPNGSPAKNYNCALNACADELAAILGDNDA